MKSIQDTTSLQFLSKNKVFSILLLLIVVALYAYHFVRLSHYLYDVPFADEWEMLIPDRIEYRVSPSWFFLHHGDHVIAPTRLLNWILLHLDGWNLVTNQIVNFVLFGLMLVVLSLLLARHLPVEIILLFLIFQLSTIPNENHIWGFQSQFHFYILFFLLSAYLLFVENLTLKRAICGGLCGVLSIVSFSAAVPAMILLVLICPLYLYFTSETKLSRKHIISVAVAMVMIVLTAILWIANQGRVKSMSSELALPTQWKFWEFFLRFPSMGFGFYETLSPTHGALCLALGFLPLLFGAMRPAIRRKSAYWIGALGYLAVVGGLASISAGRANWGEAGKAWRYGEIATLLVPFTLLLLYSTIDVSEKFRNLSLIALWCLCWLGFANDWNFDEVYKGRAYYRIEGLEQIQKYYRDGGDGKNVLFYSPIKEHLEYAKSLGLSFYRTYEREKKSD